jgi:hypothetical protein
MTNKKTVAVKDNPDLVKDTVTQAVINTNSNAIHARRNQIALIKAKDDEIQTMKADIAEIKSLLKKLGNK